MATRKTSNCARTPLFQEISDLGARFTDFAGWEMPVQFAGLKLEHEAVREAVGMFDISHMGKFTLKGAKLLSHLQPLFPSDLESLQPGQAQYTVLLNARGGIIDDVIIYYQGEDATGIQSGVAIVNAATRSRDKAWLLEHLQGSGIMLQDVSPDKVLLAVQGPQAVAVLKPLITGDIEALKAFEHLHASIAGESVFIARTGYTGEDGFEIMMDPETGRQLWRSLLAVGVTPCGLGARDTLRLEAAMALYGQDITEDTTPLEAGLGWLVHLDKKGAFIGREALEQQKQGGLDRKLIGLAMQGRYIARHGYPIIAEGEKVGEVTSGTLSPTLGKAIALAYVPKQLAKKGTLLEVEIRGKTHPATVVKKPFYRSPHRS
ncbi:glycine cleavage system aminomethyltransferase GcvT [Spirulina sp. 06S082]|uniref:glycine cleavage system aminomethyltransferase GcvT n=1 Tax=Spirulina sp. 06S082 TaxID=3110248 RepID=UPI002B214894|nr:glycine cleavage system aminomethyltransferase GcvT [Spirulina sp. 06S082]MEA5468455.1 glycine cleavage system aminomethyltransferase GcvT [Spirulina sp. 06S082]